MDGDAKYMTDIWRLLNLIPDNATYSSFKPSTDNGKSQNTRILFRLELFYPRWNLSRTPSTHLLWSERSPQDSSRRPLLPMCSL